MNKSDLIAGISEKTGLTKKECDGILSVMLETIEAALMGGNKVQLSGFGTFEVRERAARMGVNPQTKEPVQIAASKLPAFKPGKALKDAVQGK